MEPVQLTLEALLIAAAEPLPLVEVLAETALTGIHPEEYLLPEIASIRADRLLDQLTDRPAEAVSTLVGLLLDLLILQGATAQAEAAL